MVNRLHDAKLVQTEQKTKFYLNFLKREYLRLKVKSPISTETLSRRGCKRREYRHRFFVYIPPVP